MQEIFWNIIVPITTFIFGNLWAHRKHIFLVFQSIPRWNKEVRLSSAYLYRIKRSGKYLLIKGRRIHQYQPIGGVYKYYSSFSTIRQELDIRDESVSNFYEDGDLRLRIKGRYIPRYLKWFESQQNREVSAVRELVEELNSIDVLKCIGNNEIKIEFIKREIEKISYSKHFEMDEQKVLDIFEVDIPDYLMKQIEIQNNTLLVESKDILRRCVTISNESVQISETAKYLL